jgi:TatA/E family protein of Tat protein translocase
VFNLGFGEIVVILVVALIFLGPKMLPEVATGLGKVIREIRKATADIRQDIELDDMIRGPLRELRDAATLPPEELKRRDEARATQRKAEKEAAERKEREARQAQEAQRRAEKEATERKEREAMEAQEAQRKAEKEATEHKQREQEQQAKLAAAAAVKPSGPSDVISAGGTMIASPPPSDELRTLTPLPELHSPAPLVTARPPRLPVPPLPPPPPPQAAKVVPPSDATVIDLQAQLKAAGEANATLAGRTPPFVPRPPLYRPREDKKG